MARQFDDNIVAQAFQRQRGKCAMCGNLFFDRKGNPNIAYEAHHIKPYASGGSNTLSNCAVLCEDCHSEAHNYGNYRTPIQLDMSEFPYFNG